MDTKTLIVFLILVFGAVFLLTQFIVVPTFGTGRQESQRLRRRMGSLASQYQPDNPIFLIREKYLRKLSPLEKWLESLPGMDGMETFIERSGHGFPAYRLVFASVVMASTGAVLAWLATRHWLVTATAAVILAWIPVIKLKMELARRFAKFEEQLPEALDIMTQALRGGYPFNETLLLVTTELDDPIAAEFRIAFDELNYGVDMETSLHRLLDRTPSMSLTAVVTTVLVQRETGGNLAESFENTSRLIRSRFKFRRRVTTLTAETRLSSWVLALVPFVLFALLSILNPEYIRIMTQDPLGLRLIVGGLLLLIAGNVWIRKLMSLDL
jgi:tight adherence protein B